MMKDLEQLFDNNSDFYGDLGNILTKETFVKVITQLLSNLSSNELPLEKVTRLEVIDEKGRSYMNWDKRNLIALSFQDNQKTLKIFISK